MTTWADIALWVAYPYVCLTLLVVVTLYRYDTDPLGWSAKSSEILEKSTLFWGSNFFHWGIVFAFIGHLMGLFVPLWLFDALHTPEELYHLNALVVGGLAGAAVIIGVLILSYRRFGTLRVWRNSTRWDIVALLILIVTTIPGEWTTLATRGYEYRATVGPWLRSLITFHPHPELMIAVPLIMKVHIIIALGFFAIAPFTRLVHVWSLPLAYLARAPIQLRLRTPVADSPENRPSRE